MISYVVGVPGAGKTYYAVDFIYKSYEKYDRIYTNIAGFKHELVLNSFEYKHSEIYEKLRLLYSLYKKQSDEKTIVDQSKELDLFNSLFVIDEAHNYFSTNDPVLVWWLTYHRHLSQDIILITQNLALIHSKYKPLAEKFIKALPASMRIFSHKFRYNEYIESRMSKASKSGSFSLKFDKNIFSLYKSGKAEKSSSVIVKFFFLGVILLLFTFVAFYLYKLSKSSESKSSQKTIHKSSFKPVETIIDEHFGSDYYLYKILCDLYGCYINNFYIPKSKLKIILGNYKVISYSKDHDIVAITIFTNSPFLLEKSNEKKEDLFNLDDLHKP